MCVCATRNDEAPTRTSGTAYRVRPTSEYKGWSVFGRQRLTFLNIFYRALSAKPITHRSRTIFSTTVFPVGVFLFSYLHNTPICGKTPTRGIQLFAIDFGPRDRNSAPTSPSSQNKTTSPSLSPQPTHIGHANPYTHTHTLSLSPMDIAASSRAYFAMPSPTPSEKISLQASNTVYTYHCLCSHLLLATTTPLPSLPTRTHSLDKAHIMPLPPTPKRSSSSTQTSPDHYGLLLSTRQDRSPEIITSDSGFEKRYLQRCGRCNLVVGYHLDWQQFSSDLEGRREDYVFLLPGGFVSTRDMVGGGGGLGATGAAGAGAVADGSAGAGGGGGGGSTTGSSMGTVSVQEVKV